MLRHESLLPSLCTGVLRETWGLLSGFVAFKLGENFFFFEFPWVSSHPPLANCAPLRSSMEAKERESYYY